MLIFENEKIHIILTYPMRRAELPDLTKSLKVRRVDDGRQRRFHGDVAVDLVPAAPLPGARDVEEISPDGGGSSGGCDG